MAIQHYEDISFIEQESTEEYQLKLISNVGEVAVAECKFAVDSSTHITDTSAYEVDNMLVFGLVPNKY